MTCQIFLFSAVTKVMKGEGRGGGRGGLREKRKRYARISWRQAQLPRGDGVGIFKWFWQQH